MNKNSKYSPAKREEGIKLLKDGKRVVDVAKELKVPKSAVQYWKKTALGPAKSKPDVRVGDALTFLKHGRKALNESIRNGQKQASRAELFMLLALDSLEG